MKYEKLTARGKSNMVENKLRVAHEAYALAQEKAELIKAKAWAPAKRKREERRE